MFHRKLIRPERAAEYNDFQVRIFLSIPNSNSKQAINCFWACFVYEKQGLQSTQKID